MKATYTPKSEQQMRDEIRQVTETLVTLMHWNREMAIEDSRPLLHTIADQLNLCIEHLNKV